ncbi:unnamed protein product [Durusdinium trenchii]|uniref:Mei2-like C-terminal RNA recognition motif domain-containing protein n=1 Tax=Durusdinium trenchii TaxID=1381693 RepID=A0ABP0LJA7_9DINO
MMCSGTAHLAYESRFAVCCPRDDYLALKCEPNAWESFEDFEGDTDRTQSPACEYQTTVMLKNLPECFTRARMLHILRREGFDCLFNFLYVPLCFQEKRSLCYAFVNFIDHSSAKRFCQTFHGFRAWGVPSESVGEVCFCERHQGLEGIIRYYRNNSVMHSSVPDECKPILLLGTQRVPFPMPVKKIKLPKKLKNEDHVRGSSSGASLLIRISL